jgi:predicted NACHT family NTPase
VPIKELIVKSALDVAVDLVKRAFQKEQAPELPTEAALARHVDRIEHWSRHVQTFVMPEPLETDSATVQLTIGSIPRRFRAPDGSAEPLDEVSLLQSPTSIVLLGAPGAGKTTTLKRLARHFFVDSGRTIDFPWRLPVLIRIREISPVQPIDVAIAHALGLPVEESANRD